MMSEQAIASQTNEGTCRAWIFKPEGTGPWPAVLFYMDGFGIRPAMKQMAAGLAGRGYLVLLPDLYYRLGELEPLVPKEVLKGDFRAIVGPRMASTSNIKAAEDTAAFLASLDKRSDVAGKKVGTVGFCMGGGMALTAACYYPDRVGAAVSFHGGRLATDDPASPSRVFPKIKAEVYVAGADKDGGYPPEMAQRVEKELTQAGVRHKCEIYAGKLHGWM